MLFAWKNLPPRFICLWSLTTSSYPLIHLEFSKNGSRFRRQNNFEWLLFPETTRSRSHVRTGAWANSTKIRMHRGKKMAREYVAKAEKPWIIAKSVAPQRVQSDSRRLTRRFSHICRTRRRYGPQIFGLSRCIWKGWDRTSGQKKTNSRRRGINKMWSQAERKYDFMPRFLWGCLMDTIRTIFTFPYVFFSVISHPPDGLAFTKRVCLLFPCWSIIFPYTFVTFR